MAKKNFYAVELSDGRSEIVTKWADAKALIESCPSRARYKGFANRPDAEAFLAGGEGTGGADLPDEPLPDGWAAAYVDGSFNQADGQWGWAYVMLDPAHPGKTYEKCGSGTAHAEARNVTGEVYACMRAVQAAARQGFAGIRIYHDYTGVAAWATAEWKAESQVARDYAGWMAKVRETIEIQFRKVDGHSGVELNERADRLAKQGCGLA